MFDIGFWELAIIVVVGIVVVGPDRLPEVVRTLAITLRKFRRMFSDVKADISRELDLDNMRKFIQETEIEEHIKQLNQSVIDMDDELKRPIKEVSKSIDESRQTVKDIFTDAESDEKANEQADTGIEPRRPSRIDSDSPQSLSGTDEQSSLNQRSQPPPSGVDKTTSAAIDADNSSSSQNDSTDKQSS